MQTKIDPKKLIPVTTEIKKNVISIEKLITTNSALINKREERLRIQREQQKANERERRLEEEKKKPELTSGIKPMSLPKLGFLDRIKQFLLYTVLGAAFVKFGKYIPQALKFIRFLGPAFKTFENITGNILNGVVDFVGFGYKAYDKVKEIIVGISGDDTEKKLQEFDRQFNTFANLAIIAGMSTINGDDFGGGGKRGKERLGVDKQTGQRVPKRTQARYLRQYGQDEYIKRFGKRSYKGLTGKAPSRFVGKVAGKALGKVPIIGGLIDFIISTVIFKEKPGRAAAKAVGATIGSTLGTFVPVPFAGTILGGIMGDIVGGALYDSLVGDDKIKAKAQGGQVTRGGKQVLSPIRRTVKKTRTKPPRIKPQPTTPGKDIGGRKEIEKIFPSPKDPTQINSLELLETTSKRYKERVPLIGSIMGVTLDSVMGQRPDPSAFKKIGNGFGYLIQNAIDSETNGTIASIQNELIGLAGGGMIPRTVSSNESIGMKIGERIGKTLEVMVNTQVNETLQSIRQQFTRKSLMSPDGGGPGAPGGGAGGGSISVSSDSPDFWLLATAALFEGINPQGYADVAQVIYNRVAMPGDPWNTNSSIRKAILNPGQFQPVSDYGGASVWGRIKTKEDAIRHVKSYGRTQEQLEVAAAALLDVGKQNNAMQFVGPRDSFRSYDFESKNNHLADDTEVRRHGHVFGFEPRGATIESFRAGKLTPAQVSQETSGTIETLKMDGLPPTGTIPGQQYGDPRGGGRKHAGVDFDAGPNDTFYSRIGGEVTFIGNDPGGYYKYVDIYNSELGVTERIAEGDVILVKKGQKVQPGTPVARGTNATGVFHYEIRKGKSTTFGFAGTLDPLKFLSTIRNKTPQIAKPDTTTPDQPRTKLTREPWDPERDSGLKLNPKTGQYEKASLAPTPTKNLASGLNQQTSYEIAGGSSFIIRETRIIEKENQVQRQMANSGSFVAIDNSESFSAREALANA